MELAQKIHCRDVHVLLRKAGDHRFSQTDDIQILFEVLDYLVFGCEDVKELALSSWSPFTVYQKQEDLIWRDRVLKKY